MSTPVKSKLCPEKSTPVSNEQPDLPDTVLDVYPDEEVTAETHGIDDDEIDDQYASSDSNASSVQAKSFDVYSRMSSEEIATMRERINVHMAQFTSSGDPKKDAKMYRIGLHAHMEMVLALKDVKYLAGIRKPIRRHFTEVYQVAEALLFTGDVNRKQGKYRKAMTLYKAGIVYVFSNVPRTFVNVL